jgi:thioredoxin-related protein
LKFVTTGENHSYVIRKISENIEEETKIRQIWKNGINEIQVNMDESKRTMYIQNRLNSDMFNIFHAYAEPSLFLVCEVGNNIAGIEFNF